MHSAPWIGNEMDLNSKWQCHDVLNEEGYYSCTCNKNLNFKFMQLFLNKLTENLFISFT